MSVRRKRPGISSEKLDVAFHGYDHDVRELFEIPEIRDYVELLDSQFPYWLFFLTKSGFGLECITLCKMPPDLTEEARRVCCRNYSTNSSPSDGFPQ